MSEPFSGEIMGKTKPILDMLAALEAKCQESNPANEDDHIIFFHIRDIVLDVIRHEETIAALAAAASERSRVDILRTLNELRLELVTGTLPHWEHHLNELEIELEKRLPGDQQE